LRSDAINWERHQVIKNHSRHHLGISTIVARSLLAFLVVVAVLGTGPQASAGIVVDFLRYDIRVASGATQGIEKHSSLTVPGDLPPDNSMLPAPLLAGFDLHTNESDLPGHYILQISKDTASTPLRTYRNALDPAFPNPLEIELLLHTDVPGQMINISNYNIEDGNDVGPYLGWPTPGTVNVLSGDGSAANPLRVVLGIPASAASASLNLLKLHLTYTGMAIPEPATVALAVLAFLGAFGAVWRRHR
jgi:hypothetical protein